MGPKVKRRKTGSSLRIPVGTRLADGYGMDLDREARGGLPPAGIRRARPAARRRSTVRWVARLVVVAVAILSAAAIARHRRPATQGTLEVASADVRAASSTDAWTAGFFPSFIPARATDLHLLADRDAGESW